MQKHRKMIILALLLALVLTGCSHAKRQEASNTSNSSAQEEPPIVLETVPELSDASESALEAVEAEVLEEQPASERTPAAAMTLIREIKVLRFIVGFPFLYKNICEINSFRQRRRLSGFAKGPIPEGAVCEADWGSWLNLTRCERSSAKIRGCAPLLGWRKTHAREPAPLPRRSP